MPRPSRARQGCNDRRRLAGHVASFDVFFPYFLDFLRLLTRNAAFTPVPGGRAAGGVCPARRGKRPGRCAHLAGLAVHQDCTRKPAAPGRGGGACARQAAARRGLGPGGRGRWPSRPAPGLAKPRGHEPRLGHEAGHHLCGAGPAGSRTCLAHARLPGRAGAGRRAARAAVHPGPGRSQTRDGATVADAAPPAGHGHQGHRGRHRAGPQRVFRERP